MVTRIPPGPSSGTAARRTRAPGSDEGSTIGRSNAVATSRASPTTLRQSGRFAVISKSITASPSSSVSIDATSKPRRPIRSAISAADAETSTKSRSQERTSHIVYPGTEPRRHEEQEDHEEELLLSFSKVIFVFFVFLRVFVVPAECR